jgi:hypothetical protein
MKNKETFWVTNISGMNVSLSDLNLTIPARSSVNLLDDKHYTFTKEQLQKSTKEGSLFKKRNKIFVRLVPPETLGAEQVPMLRNSTFPSRERSLFSIKEEKFEELNISDTQYAEENAELADMDAQPLIKKG